MPKHVLPRRAALVALMVGSVVGLTTTVTWGQEKPQIAPEAQNAVQAMGKTLTLFSVGTKRYATLAVSGPIGQMLAEASTKMGMDFPLADLLAENPAAAFLTGVTAGYAVNTVSIDGVQCLHTFFEQPPGLELELWTEKNERALPRRLIVTYRSLPGEPRFIAALSDWKIGINPPDSDFEFRVPEGATKVELGQEKPQ
jgi:hypothetical protein